MKTRRKAARVVSFDSYSLGKFPWWHFLSVKILARAINMMGLASLNRKEHGQKVKCKCLQAVLLFSRAVLLRLLLVPLLAFLGKESKSILMALQPAVFFHLYNTGKSLDSGSIQNALSQHLFVFQLVILFNGFPWLIFAVEYKSHTSWCYHQSVKIAGSAFLYEETRHVPPQGFQLPLGEIRLPEML